MSAKVVDLHQKLWDQGRSGELPVSVQLRLLEAAFRRRRVELMEARREMEMALYWATVAPHNIESVRYECLPLGLRRQAE